jgi:formamidopyrimidine-DNA glycosylase
LPELPEVETVLRGLMQLRARTIQRITHVSPHLDKREPGLRSLAGDTCADFERRGKYIIARLTSARNLLIHLRMSGRLLIVDKPTRRDKHDHLVMTMAGLKNKLVFRDMRQFGIFEFLDGNVPPGFQSLGPEATSIRGAELFAMLQKTNRPLKAFLLDQSKLAGLGNIYVDESLHRAGLYPGLPAAAVCRTEAIKLAQAIRHILRQAIKYMGTTFDSYRGTNGESGRYRNHLRVYNRTGCECHRCGAIIEKIRLAGRGTHYCPRCQPRESSKGSGRRS